MKTKNSATLRTLILAGALGALGTAASPAALTFTLTESGGNVNYVMSGSIDLAALGASTGSRSGTGVLAYPSIGFIGTVTGLTDTYSVSIANWTPFGTGGPTFWSDSSGDIVVLLADPRLGVPHGYVSGAPLSASGYATGGTFTNMGLTPGSHVTTFSNGTHTDHVTVDVVPEAQGALLATLGLGASLLRRKRRATA